MFMIIIIIIIIINGPIIIELAMRAWSGLFIFNVS